MTVIAEYSSDWSQHLTAFLQRPLYSSNVWAIYKQEQGWRARTVLWQSPQGQAVVLIQNRSVTRLGPLVTLIQGGPLLTDDCPAATALDALLQHANPSRLGIDVLFPAQALTPALEVAMAELGFREIPIAGTGTVVLSLSNDEATLRQALSKNWRHNLNRAEKRGLSLRWIGTDLAERAAAGQRMARLYDALTERKNFAKALDANALTRAMGEDPGLEWLEVWQDDTLLASRMGWMGGDYALDLLAASSDAAKTTYANYLALWALINRSRQRGATWFDCGGIDPQGNVGVYNFKKGLNGTEVHLGRLWLRTRPGWLWSLAARRLVSQLG